MLSGVDEYETLVEILKEIKLISKKLDAINGVITVEEAYRKPTPPAKKKMSDFFKLK